MRRIVWLCMGLLVLCGIAEGHAENKAPSAANDSGRPVLSGQVAYSDPNAKGRNHQLEAQDKLELWSSQLLGAVKAGGQGSVGELDISTASYLSVLYFYCTVKQGPCPFVLESMLDAELIQASGGQPSACKSMSRFFKGYLANGLDDRGKFLYPLTRGLEMTQFNAESRPRFLECKETVAAMLADKEVIGQRFGEKGEAIESLAKFNALLKEVKDTKTDIYVATGIANQE